MTDLDKAGTQVWSYAGIAYELTLGWKRKVYGGKERVAVRGPIYVDLENKWCDKDRIRWLRVEIIALQKWYRDGKWSNRWQITPLPGDF